jgi:hypothetical protein
MIQEIADALFQSWRNFATGFALFVPRLIAAVIILVLGWIAAAAARGGVRWLLRWLRFERLALRTGASDLLRGAELPAAGVLIASTVFWVVLIGFIVSSIDALQFQPLDGLVQGFLRFVPRFLIALLVLALGFVVANLVWRATLLASVNAGLPSARLLSGAIRLLVIAVAVVMALEQIGLATAVILTAFAIAFGAVMLGLAIAFGLGGREVAREVLEQQVRANERRDSDATPHL